MIALACLLGIAAIVWLLVKDAMRDLELGKKTWHRLPRRFYRCDICGGYHITSHAKRLGQ